MTDIDRRINAFRHECCMKLAAVYFLQITLDLLDWQSVNKCHPLGSVNYHLGSIDGVEASRVEVVLD